jgi:hypothetical protein
LVSLDINTGDAGEITEETGMMDEEYRKAAFRVGLRAQHFPAGALLLSLDYHYMCQDGNPQFDSVVSSLFDFHSKPHFHLRGLHL